MVTIHIAVLIVPLVILLALIIFFAISRGEWMQTARWRELNIKDYQDEARERNKDFDAFRKRYDLIESERAFWRTKAIHLGYPAAVDE